MIDQAAITRAVRALRPDVVSFGVTPEGQIFDWNGDGDDPPSAEVIADKVAELDGPLPVTVVSMRQARLAMLQAGILDNVIAVVEQAGAAAMIEWEYAVEVRRDHPLIVSLAVQLEISGDDIDALFQAAAQID